MSPFAKVHWGFVLLGGFLSDLLLFVLGMLNLFSDKADVYAIPLEFLVVPLVFGFGVARRARASFLLHGVLVGVAAVLIVVPFQVTGTSLPLPLAPVVAISLKIVGGWIGGLAASRQFKWRAPQTHRARSQR